MIRFFAWRCNPYSSLEEELYEKNIEKLSKPSIWRRDLIDALESRYFPLHFMKGENLVITVMRGPYLSGEDYYDRQFDVCHTKDVPIEMGFEITPTKGYYAGSSFVLGTVDDYDRVYLILVDKKKIGNNAELQRKIFQSREAN